MLKVAESVFPVLGRKMCSGLHCISRDDDTSALKQRELDAPGNN